MAENYSVLMSVYYKEQPQYLKTAVNSMLNQTIKTNDFVLVCDGKLSEELDAVIEEFQKRNPGLFNVIRLKENMGLSRALNSGIVECKNDIIARMDSDDISKENRMERQLAVMESNGVHIVSGTVSEFDGTIDNIRKYRELPQTHDEIVKFAKKRSPFNHPAVTFRKYAVIDAGLYEGYTYFEDYNLWATMLNMGFKGYNINEPVLYMRAGEEMYKRRGGIKYVKYILKFSNHLRKIKFISNVQFLKSLITRSVVSVLPNGMRTFIYARLLRNNKVD